MKKILIIGAGIAGLSAGCYAQMNCYKTEIFEMHDLPGGECTSWRRKDYIFDGCIHWLVGSGPNSELHDIWNEIHALEGMEIVNHDEFMRVEDSLGRTAVIYTDIDKLEKHLIELSPEDSSVIREIAKAVRRFKKFSVNMEKPREVYKRRDWINMVIKMAPFIKDFAIYNSISIEDYAKKIKDPLIRDSINRVMPSDYTMLSLIINLATFSNRDGGYPVGGSLKIAKNIEKRYLDIGGKINYKSKVESIIIKNDRAVGIKLSNGEEVYGDLIISAADGYHTIFNLLEGKYVSSKIKKLYTDYSTYQTYTSVQVSLGVDFDLANEPHNILIKPEEPLFVGGIKHEYISLRNYCYDKTLCPEGKSVVVSLMDTSFEYWEKLYGDRAAYKAEKQKIVDNVIKLFEERFPEAAGKVEVVDVVTPITYKRYTNAWKGSYMPWKVTPKTGMLNISKTLPGLYGFYMIGQWTMPPGGLPSALITGRWIIQRLCKHNDKEFIKSEI